MVKTLANKLRLRILRHPRRLNCRWWIGRRVKKKWGWNWPLCAHGRGKRGQAHSEQSEQVWKCFKRDSRPVCIPAGKLMPLVPGDKFPADAYLFPSFSIQPALFRCVPNDVRSFNLCNCSASTRYALQWRRDGLLNSVNLNYHR